MHNFSIRRLGFAISAALAVPYAVVMFAGLLLVGMGTTGSLQAALLGVRWGTVVGFEVGLLGIVMAGFAIAAAFVLGWSVMRSRLRGVPSAARHAGDPGGSITRSRSFRVLIAFFVLLPLILLGLHTLAPRMSSAATVDADAAQALIPVEPVRAQNMGPVINSAFREAEPSFTADGRTMYFNCRNADICVSHLVGSWEAGTWAPPELVGAPISTGYEEIEPVINGAGDTLYFTSIRPKGFARDLAFLSPFVNVVEVLNRLVSERSGQTVFGGLGLDDVYISRRVNGVWTEPESINDFPGEPHVNTPFADHCLFFSADGKEAFWTSTRPGGFGSDDIWTARRVDGKWSEPENEGPNVNGPGSEHTSIPTPDGRALYVTATRAEGLGGEDIYVTTRSNDGIWGPLVNLGAPVNGPGDDRCPAWTPDFKYFVFDSVRASGRGARDIWWVYFTGVMGHPPAASANKAARGPLVQPPD